MAEKSNKNSSRRDFMKNTTAIAGAAAIASSSMTHIHAGEDNTINIALVGCGGRGSGAIVNALTREKGPLKLVAMADVFENNLKQKYRAITHKLKDKADRVDVPEEQKFIGFDAYKKAMDCLKPGDIVILTTPPAFRWVHFTYAIEKGLNVFMEKPVTVDGPTSRKMFKLAEKADELNLKVGVGLMCRHCKARKELYERIQGGEIGDILELRAYRMAGPTGSAAVGVRPESEKSELAYQIKNFHGFIWASGGAYSDFLIHNIDESCWMKNAWPVKAQASGGRHYRLDNVDQNFDTYSVEYTFADGTKLFLNGRTMAGCHHEFASYAHGTKGSAIISTASHSPAKCKTFKGHNMVDKNMIWAYPQPEENPYELEWDDLLDAIRNDKPYNEVKRGVQASLVTSMGRLAAHTGQVITYDQMLNHEHELAPTVDQLTMTGPAPVQANDQGKYPIPLPGINRKTEY